MVRFFLRVVKGAYLRHGISLNIIEPDRIDDEKNELTADGNQIRMGVDLTVTQSAQWLTGFSTITRAIMTT